MALILGETILRLGFHISSTRYLEDGASCFTEVIEHDNIGFDRKVVENENGAEDSKEAVIDSEEGASKKRARRKIKQDAVRVRALLLTAVPGLSASASVFVSVSGLSIVLLGLYAPTSASVSISRSFAIVPELSAAVPESSVAMLGLSATMLGSSVAMPRLSTPTPKFASVPVPGLSTPIPLSAPVLPGSSPQPFPILSLPKIPTPDLATGRQ